MAKRKQVKNACVNCQRACKKCDDCRPCSRCLKYGVEESCVNSSRKERRRSGKRGAYRAALTRDTLDTDSSSWTPESERSVRPRRSISYREQAVDDNDDGDEDEDEDEDESADESVSEQRGRSARHDPPIGKLDRHLALFKMVLGVMHGDLVIPADQPRLSELAAVCSELAELEHKVQKQKPQSYQSFTDPPAFPYGAPSFGYEADRLEHNRTPAPEFILRDVPSPPCTPVSHKTHATHGGPSMHSRPYYVAPPLGSSASFTPSY